MNEREADTYEQLFERIRSEIEQAEKEIFETKIELEQARKIRRNRMEYDAMAKVNYTYILVLYSPRINIFFTMPSAIIKQIWIIIIFYSKLTFTLHEQSLERRSKRLMLS